MQVQSTHSTAMLRTGAHYSQLLSSSLPLWVIRLMPYWQKKVLLVNVTNVTALLLEKLQERHRLSSLVQGLTPFPARTDVLRALLHPQVSPCSSFLAARFKSFSHTPALTGQQIIFCGTDIKLQATQGCQDFSSCLLEISPLYAQSLF